MDKECLVKLNIILQEVSSRNRPIDDLDEIPSWFSGTEEEVKERVQEVQELFASAYDSGMINRWVTEHARRGPSTNWDWTTTAHRKASRIGITLVNPIGENKEDTANG